MTIAAVRTHDTPAAPWSRRRLLGTSTALVLLLGTAACSSDDGTDQSEGATTSTSEEAPTTSESSTTTTTEVPGLTDPCQLVTKEEAEAMVGRDLYDGRSNIGDEAASCTYGSSPEGSVAQVEVFTGAGAEQIYDIDSQLSTPLEELAGIGDEAWHKPKQIYFRVGSTWTVIRLVRIDNDPYTEELRTAALAAIERM